MRVFSQKIFTRRRSLVVALIFLIILGGVYFVWRSKADSPNVPASTQSSIRNTNVAAEVPISQYEWKGAPQEPKYIRLPSINSEGYIQKVGMKNQEIAAPSNIHLAGWFDGSVTPGQPGLSIIDGHVDGVSQPGIFLHLDRLQHSAHFTVELGDGSVKTYEVIDVVQVDLNNALSVLFSQRAGVSSQLNLITCGGKFNNKTKMYDKRVVISAKLI